MKILHLIENAVLIVFHEIHALSPIPEVVVSVAQTAVDSALERVPTVYL
jgi:hypothetical protein